MLPPLCGHIIRENAPSESGGIELASRHPEFFGYEGDRVPHSLAQQWEAIVVGDGEQYTQLALPVLAAARASPTSSYEKR